MEFSGAELLALAAVLMGVAHAFDADHLATVAAMASTRGDRRNSIRYSLHWALGHGATLVLLALALLLFGVRLPPEVNHLAEALVGLVLIVMGAWLLRGAWRFLRSDAVVELPIAMTGMKRKPLLIGSLHGIAGSAPVLLVFLVDVGSPLFGLGLVMIFVAGVCLSMMVIGLLLGFLLERIGRQGPRPLHWLRAMFAGLSLLVGGIMVHGIL